MAHKSYGKGYKSKKMSVGSTKMKHYAKDEAGGTRPGESAYVEHRKAPCGPYVPK